MAADRVDVDVCGNRVAQRVRPERIHLVGRHGGIGDEPGADRLAPMALDRSPHFAAKIGDRRLRDGSQNERSRRRLRRFAFGDRARDDRGVDCAGAGAAQRRDGDTPARQQRVEYAPGVCTPQEPPPCSARPTGLRMRGMRTFFSAIISVIGRWLVPGFTLRQVEMESGVACRIVLGGERGRATRSAGPAVNRGYEARWRLRNECRAARWASAKLRFELLPGRARPFLQTSHRPNLPRRRTLYEGGPQESNGKFI